MNRRDTTMHVLCSFSLLPESEWVPGRMQRQPPWLAAESVIKCHITIFDNLRIRNLIVKRMSKTIRVYNKKYQRRLNLASQLKSI